MPGPQIGVLANKNGGSKHIEQEKVDCQLGIKPRSLDYMLSVIPLDHQQSSLLTAH